MALNTNELYSQTTRGPLPRMQYAAGPGAVKIVTFAGGTAETLPLGTPVFVAAATGFVAKLVPGSATAEQTEVWGFICGTEVKTAASGEVLGTIMTKGSIHYDDVLAIQTATVIAGTEAQLKTALRKPIVRERGLVIEGLDLQGKTA